VAKIDQAEIYAPIQHAARLTGAMVLALLLAVGLAGNVVWRQRHAHILRRAFVAEQGRRALGERLTLLTRHANDIILLFDEQQRILEANDRALAAYGRTLEEMRQLQASDLRSPTAAPLVERDFSAALQATGFVFETTHRRKDGSEFPVEVSTRSILTDGRQQVLSIVRDITQRKAHEEEIERLNRMFFVISQVNQALVRAKDRSELFTEVCRVLVDIGRFRIAWIGWLTPATRLIEPVAVAGDTHGYVAGLRISADPAQPEGRGPSGTAFREGRTYICNDFFADPATALWRELAAQSGFQSSIALPLRCEGAVVGLLTVYAAERNFFQPRKIELLDETAGDISFALDIFARDERRLAAEAAVRASESRLQFLITATPAIIYSLRAGGDFRTTFLSPNVREILGYEPETLVADPQFWLNHLHPEDAAKAVSGLGELDRQPTVVREYRFRHADGSWRWMHDETRVVRAADGRDRELVGYWFDITARKQAEADLAAREEIFSSIVSQALDAIALVDVATGAFLEFNRSAHEGLGYTREEFAKLAIVDIQAEHSLEKIGMNYPPHPGPRRAVPVLRRATATATAACAMCASARVACNCGAATASPPCGAISPRANAWSARSDRAKPAFATCSKRPRSAWR
jgi:PAS domain S-box-containing protein